MTARAFVTANGLPVVWADVTRPRVGAWHADLSVDSQDQDALAGEVTVDVGGAVRLVGTATRCATYGDTVFVRVVGGRGGLGVELRPRAYSNVPARLPLGDALSEAGEALSPTSDAAAMSTLLAKWVRVARPAGAELSALVAATGAKAWRVLPDGTVWLGHETWAPASFEWQELGYDPRSMALDISSDAPDVSPGQVLPAPGSAYDGRRVSLVRHVVSAESIRHQLLFEDEWARDDRSKADLEGYLRTRIQPQIDMVAGYWAKVVSQNADGSLELDLDDERFPGLSGVPIRYGVPGTSAKVSPGARVLVEFTGGQPSKPFATAWEQATVTELVLGGGTTQPAALATALRTELDAIWLALQTHLHGGVTTGGGTTGAATVVKAAQTIASSVVQVKA